jgi:hypothetical protein
MCPMAVTEAAPSQAPAPVSRPARAPAGWLDTDPADLRPTVLVLGGFMTSAPIYRDFEAALRARGAADVVVAPIWTPDWILASVRGMGPLTTRAGKALLRASAASEASPASRGAPVLIVGHSAGGMLARLLTSPVPFEGRRLNGSSRIGAIVTLGTPHVATDGGRWGGRIARAVARFAEVNVPGACFAPTTGYLSVASRAIAAGENPRDGTGRFVRQLYDGVLPQPGVDPVTGDGLVPTASALLEGATQLVLDGAVHAPARRLVAGRARGVADRADGPPGPCPGPAVGGGGAVGGRIPGRGDRRRGSFDGGEAARLSCGPVRG